MTKRLFFILLLSLFIIKPENLLAQAKPVLDQIKDLYQKSIQSTDNLKLKEAKAFLDEAIDLVQKNSVTDKYVANLYIQRGIVLLLLTNNKENVTYHEFVKALKIDSTVKLDPLISTPQIIEIYKKAKLAIKPKVIPKKVEPILFHKPVESIDTLKAIEITAKVGGVAGEFSVYLYYKNLTEPTFKEIEFIKSSDGGFLSMIPGDRILSQTILYFIVVRDKAERIVVSNGSETSPLQIAIRVKKIPITSQKVTPKDPRRWPTIGYIILTAGTGVGWAGGRPQQKGDEVIINKGFALAPFHTYTEISFYLLKSRMFSLGGYFNLELVQASSKGLAYGGGIVFKWFALYKSPYRLFVKLAGGYGEIKHSVSLRPQMDFTDFTLEGPYNVNIGIGFVWDFHKNVGLVIEPTFGLYFGNFFSFNIDFGAGLKFSF